MDEFLFQTKTGYCEHFSSAFVFLMRAAGVPARVVTGYAGGYRNPVGDYWIVRNSDAHAWAEVWLAGRGWVRVDPTAAVAPERIYDTTADRVPGRIGSFDGLELPRAEILKNAFVLWPLALLAPEAVHPVAGKPFAELWATAQIDQQLWPVPFAWRGVELTPAALLQAYPTPS